MIFLIDRNNSFAFNMAEKSGVDEEKDAGKTFSQPLFLAAILRCLFSQVNDLLQFANVVNVDFLLSLRLSTFSTVLRDESTVKMKLKLCFLC